VREWSGSRAGRFTLGEQAPVTRWIGGWMGPRIGLDAVAKKRKSCLCRELNPGRTPAQDTLR